MKIIVSKVASTPDEVETYAQCTLLAASLSASDERSSHKLNAVKACVDYLQENELIARRTLTVSGMIHVFLYYFILTMCLSQFGLCLTMVSGPQRYGCAFSCLRNVFIGFHSFYLQFNVIFTFSLIRF